MTLGRAAGKKVCDDCARTYAGPAYRTFSPSDCVTYGDALRGRRHERCTGNTCPDCSGYMLEPDRPDDPRRPAPPVAS